MAIDSIAALIEKCGETGLPLWEVILEEDLREIPQKSGKVLLEFRPYEIKTIRVRQGSAPSEN